MKTKSCMLTFINNKNIIDESLGINLIKYEDIEYMNDDVSGFKKWI